MEQVRVCEHQGQLCPVQLEEASSRPQRKSQRVEERSLTEVGVRTLVTLAETGTQGAETGRHDTDLNTLRGSF